MLTRRAFSVAALAGLSVPAAGCETLLGYRIRYKSVLTVTDGGRTVTAEGLAESLTKDNPFGGVHTRTKGETAVADLGGGRAVAALMRGLTRRADGRLAPGYDAWTGWAMLTYLAPSESVWEDGRNAAYRDLSKMRRSQPMPIAGLALPVIVYFPDRRDMQSAVLLNLGEPQAADLPSVKMTVELTRERLFKGHPERILPWATPPERESRGRSAFVGANGEFELSWADIVRPRFM